MTVSTGNQRESFQAREVRFTNKGMSLSGLLLVPATPGSHPGLVFVHGSGAADRDGFGYLPPIREQFARQGFAVFCYDKPGVGNSTGDWTKQTFADRAQETLAAVRCLQEQPNVDASQVGLWGISQAGWIMPLAATQSDRIAFIVSVSGSGVKSYEQEAFRIAHQMRADGFSEDEIEQALAVYEQRLRLMRQDKGIDEILAMQRRAEQEAWFPYLGSTDPKALAFFITNVDFDPIPLWRQVHCPVLAIWGERDTLVPAHQSARLIAGALKEGGNADFLTKLFSGANHGIGIAESGGRNEPWQGFVPGYLELMVEWLQARSSGRG